jgi:hypothetical protein
LRTRTEQRQRVVTDEAHGVRARGQALFRVVAAQEQAVLRAAREHAIGLARIGHDEIVDHHADVGLVAAEHERRAVLHPQRRIDAGDQALTGGFLVAGRAVDLSGEEQARHFPHRERVESWLGCTKSYSTA